MLTVLMTDAERFELYIALRRFRTAMWKHHPFLRFVRWSVVKLSRVLERPIWPKTIKGES